VKPIRFFERKEYSSTEIREKMVKGQNWQKLVPKSVATFIKEIDGLNRLKDLIKTDKA
jgi:nicotinamide-nucleotide adenylyltransferase